MPEWNAGQYLKFAEERTRPCRDLVAALRIENIETIIDLGCGPGNSTQVLAGRWPQARIIGLDSSIPMIESARRESPSREWLIDDIVDWADNDSGLFTLVFSNAALQWVDAHEVLLPKLLKRVSPGGALAFQIPADFDALPHRLMREVAPEGVHVKEWHSHEPGFYYRVLSPHAARVDIWLTDYQHIVDSAESIVEWYKGSGLRPFLEAISGAEEQQKFLSAFKERLQRSYPSQPDGKVLFPFKRLFVAAYSR